jgi:hypothetical protein
MNTDKPAIPAQPEIHKSESRLSATLSGDDVPAMGEAYWLKAYHELSRLQVRTVEQNDSLRKENQKLRLSLMMFGDERFEN